jgi:pimeloyl-ACP methyl ester carboxylesterase
VHREWIWRGHRVRYTFTAAQSGFQALSRASNQPAAFLLIHGFGASVRHWRSNLGPLSRDRSVYAIDLLGFGASDKDGTVYGTALWVEQLFDFVTEVVGRSVVVVGNSLGSVVGLGLAAKHPDAVAAIAWLNLPDFSAVAMPAVLKVLTQPIGEIAKRVITVSPFFVPFFRWIRQPRVIRAWVKGAYVDETRLDGELVEILSSPAYDRHASRALAAMVLSQRALPSEYTARSALPGMSLPMLLIWGAKDQFVPPKIAQTIVSFNSAVEFVSLPEVGHCPHDEVPDVINPILLSWLDRVLVRSSAL